MTAEELWNKYIETTGDNSLKDTEYEAWGFGDDTDKLLSLVLQGIKKATSSAYDLYFIEGEEEPLPRSGEYSVLLDSKDKAICIIKTVRTAVVPFNEMTQEEAAKEGEGNLSLKYWQDIHKKFFTEELKEYNLNFSQNMKVVFEEFEVVYSLFTVQDISEEQVKDYFTWKYPDQYAVYNSSSYEEAKAKNKAITDPIRRKDRFFSVIKEGQFMGTFSIKEEDDFTQIGLAVKPEYCGQGNGNIMTNLAVARAQYLFPQKDIALSVRTFNERAIKCYKAAGFEIIDTYTETRAPVPGEMYRMKKTVHKA